VVVYTHSEPTRLTRLLAGERIHRAEALEIYGIDRELLAEWAARLTRRVTCGLTVSDGQLILTVGEATLIGGIETVSLTAR
jgi:uncharacterized protein YaeQ